MAVLFAVGSEITPTANVREHITILEVPEEPPPPPLPPPQVAVVPPEAVVVDVPVKGFQTLPPPPEVVPVTIPPPAVALSTREEDYSGAGVEGGRSDGVAMDSTPSRVVTAEDIDAAPRFTPLTEPPMLLNARDVARELARVYPPLLRQAGVGGTVVMWFLLDPQGQVVKYTVKTSSGRLAFDSAAHKVAAAMRFTPAKDHDQAIRAWVAIPIVFSAR